MEFPTTRRVLLSLGVIALVYALLLPVWLGARMPYAAGVAAAANHVAFPATGLEGTVKATRSEWVSLTYTLPYPPTGGWGQCRQRFLDFADLPLALAVAAGLGFLGWRRRMVAGLAGALGVFVCHLGLVTWTAHRLTRVLGDPTIPVGNLDQVLHETAREVTGYGNISAVVTLGMVVGVALFLLPGRHGAGAPGGPRA